MKHTEHDYHEAGYRYEAANKLREVANETP